MRYFFHLHNDIDTQDEEGRELPDIEAARTEALKEAREMASESVGKGHLNLDHFIAVADQDGEELFVTTFADAVQVITVRN